MLEELKQARKLYLLTFLCFALIVAGVIYLLRRPEPRAVTVTTPTPRPTPTSVIIQVQVAGAIKQPGVYKFPEGARVTDALDAAGGPVEEADLSHVNLARKLKDGELLSLPVKTPAPPTATVLAPSTDVPSGTSATASAPTVTRTPQSKININTAGPEELDKLPHIGPVLAQRIIDYRTQYGPFQKIEDIKNVKGIGDSFYDAIKDLITVTD